MRIFFLGLIFYLLSSCDPEHKKKCEWYLVPDVDRRPSHQKEGLLSVCARNFVVNKQDCRLVATEEFAKEYYSKKFRYIDLKTDGVGIPRQVISIETCEN